MWTRHGIWYELEGHAMFSVQFPDACTTTAAGMQHGVENGEWRIGKRESEEEGYG